jgi:hypothetical protein
MTDGLVSEARLARRQGMTLVRLQAGVLPSGLPADQPCLSHKRPVHVVPEALMVKANSDGGPGAVAGTEPVAACCGLEFEPGAVEAVAWGTVWPHEVCVRKTGHPRSFVSRVYREARDWMLRTNASDEDIDASTALMEKVLLARGRDWVQDESGDIWTYEASFNGVFPGDRLHPRGRDIGLERLTVEVPYPGVVHIHACGVRDGCSRHLARTETFSLDDMEAVEKRITSHQVAATSIPLMELAWCLVTGDCSAVPVYEAVDPLVGARHD